MHGPHQQADDRGACGVLVFDRIDGADVVEGYPADTGADRVDVISGYVGTVRMFEAAGAAVMSGSTGVPPGNTFR